MHYIFNFVFSIGKQPYNNKSFTDRLEVHINTIVKKGAYITLTHTHTHSHTHILL